MNGKDIHDAMEFVGHDLVDLAEKQQFGRSALQIILPTAAAIALILGVGTVFASHWQPAVAEPTVGNEVLLEEIVVVEEELAEVQPEEVSPETPAAHPLLTVFPQLDAATLPETGDWEAFYLNEAGRGSRYGDDDHTGRSGAGGGCSKRDFAGSGAGCGLSGDSCCCE